MRELLASSTLFTAAARVVGEIVAVQNGTPKSGRPRVVSDAPPGWSEPVVMG